MRVESCQAVDIFLLLWRRRQSRNYPQARAATINPNNSITHHLPGQSYRDLERTEDAERELKIAKQLQASTDSKP
jgi:hypothetical protein